MWRFRVYKQAVSFRVSVSICQGHRVPDTRLRLRDMTSGHRGPYKGQDVRSCQNQQIFLGSMLGAGFCSKGRKTII